MTQGVIQPKDIGTSPATADRVSFWPTSNTECHNVKSIQTAGLNKSASRGDRSIQHQLSTEEETPLGRKSDSLKHVDPTKSLSFDGYFLRDHTGDLKKLSPCRLGGGADVTLRQRNSLQDSHRVNTKFSSLCIGL